MNIKQYFHLEEVDHFELQHIILSHFGHGRQIELNSWRYQKNNSEHFIDVITSKKGKILNIVLSENFPNKELSDIQTKIKHNLIEDHGVKIAQVIAFSLGEIVNGWFKYKNLFQILPIPENAPKPRETYAEHPFLLQLSYSYSPEFMISNTRIMQKATTYARLLNLLSNCYITSGSTSSRKYWILNTDNEKDIKSEWRQQGYSYKGFTRTLDKFSNLDRTLHIELVPPEKYYLTPPAIRLQNLTLPNNIEESLTLALNLPQKTWDKFFVACSWYAQYHDLWHVSRSSAFMALISSIESLKGRSQTGEITKGFKDFIKEHCPIRHQFQKEIDILYNFRSAISHGEKMLQEDLSPWKLPINSKATEERQLQQNLFFIVKTTIYKWLQEQAKG